MKKRIAAGVVLLAVVVCAAYFASHRRQVTVVAPPAPSLAVAPPSAPPAPFVPVAPPPRVANIYTVTTKGGDSNDLSPHKVTVPAADSPARNLLQAMIQSPHTPLPSGTRLLSIRIDSGLATVNFSQEFQKNFHGGDLQEAQAINSILMTLGQFPNIDRVQILVEGSAIDSLGGHFEISTPIDVIRPGDVQQASNDVN